jgi:Na+/H+-dicarboxylate symporter
LRIERERRELRNTYRNGWQMTGIAVILLAVCLGLASIFTSDLTEKLRPLTRRTFEYGFEIIGWVLLWHPIHVLAFAPLPIRARISALHALASMDVVIRADQAAADMQ